MRCMKPNMRWLDKVKSTLQPDEPESVSTLKNIWTQNDQN